MKKLVIYHGSDHRIEKPQYNYEDANPNNDYGLAFYCTLDKEAGKEWACRKSKNGVLNAYEIDTSDLEILDLTDKTKFNVLNWIALLMHNRDLEPEFKEKRKIQLAYLETKLPDITGYDIIIGYRADDAYFRFPQKFVDNKLTLGTMEEIYFNGELGVQFVVYSEKAFNKLKFIKTEDVREEYYYKYQQRVEDADKEYYKLESEQEFAKGIRINDLIEMGQK